MPIKHAKEPGKAPTSDFGIPPELIREQLHRIHAHPEFHGTPQQEKFLRFVVLETLKGRAHEIKGYTVATEVFGRKADFDPKIDPIVSIQANKLRRAVERYYLVAGRDDPVRIDIPKGTYVPTFQLQKAEGSDAAPCGEEPEISEGLDSWPTVLVRPFRNLTGDPEQDYVAAGLTTELAVELSRYQDIRVLMPDPEVHGRKGPDRISRFSIEGSVRRDTAGIKVTVQLVDTSTGVQVWADALPSNLEPSQLIAFQEEVGQAVAARLAGEHGIISKTLSAGSRAKPPSDLTTYEAILRFYEFDRVVTVDTYHRALAALEAAAEIEPECGQVWSLLGRLYGHNIAFEYPEVETPLDKALAFAHRGVLLNPADQRARAILAFVRMLANDIPAARAEAERALALNPGSLFFMDNIGYLLTLLGEWERGPALIERAMKRNPYYHTVVHFPLWLNWFRQEEYEQAYLETLNFRMTGNFWEPLAQAATLGQLGRHEEGKRAAEALLRLKPEFPSRGRVLIGHYIKFDDIVKRVVEGLRRAGMDIE